jgi:prepilin-type N-terminal cleavage/methylation domain-containing protein/prepilin-type processing-associated H-X9-DG protein
MKTTLSPGGARGCKTGHRAFTLLELLVVIAIISTLAALLVPTLKTAKDKANQAKCASNMKQFGMAFVMYAETHNGWLPENWDDNDDNWQSQLVDADRGGNYFGGTNSMRSIIPSWTPPCIRVSTRLLCPTTVKRCATGPSGTVISLTDPHEQWGYSYNHCRGSVSWALNGEWPWFVTVTGGTWGVDTRVLYRHPSKYIIMADGNGANYNPNDWDATTGDFAAYDYPISVVHSDGVNALYLDGHVQYMPLRSASDKAAFNRDWYAGCPISGNPWPE